MSTAEAPRRPIEVFLGHDASSGGPYALLELDPSDCTEPLILAALDRQLGRIDRHPQGRTPAGDEVRLALHAAAAQLMDPSVRSHMLARWGQRAAAATRARPPGEHHGPPPTPVAVAPVHSAQPAPRPVPQPVADPWVDPQLENDALRAIALAGGPNPEAIRRIGMLAAARGIPAAQVPAVVRGILERRSTAGRPGAAPAQPPTQTAQPILHDSPPARRLAPRPQSFVTTSATGGIASPSLEPNPFAPRPYEDDAASRTFRTVILCAVIGIILMGGAFWAVLLLTAPTGPAPAVTRDPDTLIGHNPEPELPEALFPRGTNPESAANRATQNAAAPEVDAPALVDEFRACVAAQSVDPAAAAEAFTTLNARAGAVWPRIPLDRRRAIIDLVVEYVYRAASSDGGPIAAIEDAGAGAAAFAGAAVLTPEQVGQASWSVGLLVRLQRERDISARAGSLIETRLGAVLEGSRPVGASAFDAGAAAALGAMPARLIPASGEPIRTRESIDQRLEAWRRWLAGVNAVSGTDSSARAGLVLAALDVLIRDAAQPTDDRLVFEAMALLIEALDFSESGSARAWLIRAMDAPAVSAADAHALTNAVATRAPAAQLDVSMVLAPRATDLERREMRDRLAILWNLADPADRDALASAWREARADALARRTSDLTPFEHLATAVVLSRVSQAALLRWRGMTAEADDLLATLSDEVDATLSTAAAPRPSPLINQAGDGAWADNYLQAGRSIPIRLDLLQQAARSMTTTIGPVDAEVLLSEAVRGSPAAVATAAYDIVMRLVGSPSIVNALLEELPQLPKTRRNAQLVGALTGARLPIIRDQRWELAARRAAVTRLLELLAADGQMRTYDDLSALLARSYMGRSESILGARPRQGATDPPEFAAAVLRSQWRRQAEPLLPPPALALSLDEVERRRASRLELAEGPVQTFAAEQLASVELMALVVAGEQPDQAPAVRAILDDLARARQRARHITEQLAAGEVAASALWGVRLREGAAP